VCPADAGHTQRFGNMAVLGFFRNYSAYSKFCLYLQRLGAENPPQCQAAKRCAIC